MTEVTPRMRSRLLLAVLALPPALLVGEIAARAWVAFHYPRERVEQLTQHSSVRGRFASHPYLPFALNPGFHGHNSLGFRGGAIEPKKPANTRRIACIGASTTYGSLDDPEDSFPAQLGLLMNESPGRWDVINAGVPGWVSCEMLIQLGLRVLPLEPDFVVILLSRNEIFPQTYNDFRSDYTHYRRPGFNFVVSNHAHKALFRWSHLFMLACTVGGERFGWSEIAEHPLYGGIRWENQPTPAEVERHVQEPERLSTLRRNLEAMIAMCQPRGIRVLVCTIAIRPEKLALDELARRIELAGPLARLIDLNNEVAREVAKEHGVRVVETAELASRGELFLDDCHLTAEGHRLEARMIHDQILPLLESQ